MRPADNQWIEGSIGSRIDNRRRHDGCGRDVAGMAKSAQIITGLANGLEAEAYRTGQLQNITRVAKPWADALRRARPATAAT